MSKEGLLDDVGYIVDEMEIRGSAGCSCEDSEAEAGDRLALWSSEVDEDMSEGCLPWESQGRGDGLLGVIGLPLA